MVMRLHPGTQVFVFTRTEKKGNSREASARHGPGIFRIRRRTGWTPSSTPPRHGIPLWSRSHLRPGGRLVINAIRKEDADKNVLLKLDYPAHLWMEKEIRSVANVTRRDIEEFLKIASKFPSAPRSGISARRRQPRASRVEDGLGARRQSAEDDVITELRRQPFITFLFPGRVCPKSRFYPHPES